jgi:protein-tyrosine phosphatase
MLPEVDDGAKSESMAFAMAKAAVADGVDAIVVTPHVNPEMFPYDIEKIRDKLSAFQMLLQEKSIPLRVFLGGEARISPELLDMIEMDHVPFLGTVDEYRILLLELPHQTIPIGTEMLIAKLLRNKIRPLIAHPERNKAVIGNPEKLRPYLDAGCWLQATAGSLAGRFGDAVKQTALKLFENEWVHVIATDAHNLKTRPPCLSEGRDAVAARFGHKLAWQMVVERPARILGISAVTTCA